jgi:hypothetical protein
VAGQRTTAWTLVETYASFGDQRTGTEADTAVAAWLAGELSSRGAEVRCETWDVPLFDASWSVTVDGTPVTSLPVFYEAVGDTVSDRPLCAVAPPDGPADLHGLERLMTEARRTGAGAVVAASGNGRVHAVNRRPVLGSGVPVLCVAELPAPGATVRVSHRAELRTGQACDLVATVPGPTDAPPLLITTPRNGWFRCAGERGTGIALVLGLIERLAGTVPLTVIATGGHELGNLGAHATLRRGVGPVRGVLHVGASVAAGEPDGHGELKLTSGLRLATRGIDAPAGAIAGDDQGWWGEAAVWAALDAPLVSLAGSFPLFHTPDDVPGRATSPALLEQQADVLDDLVDRLLRSAR